MAREFAIVEENQPRKIPRKWTFDFQDVLVLFGIGFLEAGATVIWWPSALILAGILCLAFAFNIGRMKDDERHGR